MIQMLKGLRRRRHGGRDAGAVATEFAILMAFVPLAVMAFGIVDYGEVMAQATNLAAIVRGAAEYARGQVVQGNPPATAANLNTLLGVPSQVFPPMACPDGTTANPCQFCTCADGTTPNPLPACPALGSNTNNPCAAKTDTRVLSYVMVSGSQTYTPIVSGTWPFPPSVNARTVLRTQ